MGEATSPPDPTSRSEVPLSLPVAALPLSGGVAARLLRVGEPSARVDPASSVSFRPWGPVGFNFSGALFQGNGMLTRKVISERFKWHRADNLRGSAYPEEVGGPFFFLGGLVAGFLTILALLAPASEPPVSDVPVPARLRVSARLVEVAVV